MRQTEIETKEEKTWRRDQFSAKNERHQETARQHLLITLNHIKSLTH